MKFAAGKRFYQMLHGRPIFLRSLSLSLWTSAVTVSTELQRSRLSDQRLLTCKKKKEREGNGRKISKGTSKGSFLILFIRKHDIKSTMKDSDMVKKKKKIEYYIVRFRKKVVVSIFKWNISRILYEWIIRKIKLWYYSILLLFFFNRTVSVKTII